MATTAGQDAAARPTTTDPNIPWVLAARIALEPGRVPPAGKVWLFFRLRDGRWGLETLDFQREFFATVGTA